MSKRTLSIIVDAAYVERQCFEVLKVIEDLSPKHLAFETHLIGAMRHSVMFWGPLLSVLPSIHPSGVDISFRTFVFDGAYVDSKIDALQPSGDVPSSSRSTMLSRSARRQSYLYSVPRLLFDDAVIGNPPGTATTIGVSTISGPGWSFSVELASPGLSVIHTSQDPITNPGLYLGHLSISDNGKITQKTVDAMASLCIAGEAQHGHDIVLYGEDTDFIPAAVAATGLGRSFNLCCLGGEPKHWQSAKSRHRRINFMTPRLPVPVLDVWSEDKRAEACARVREAFNLGPLLVYPYVFSLPPTDVELLRKIDALAPAPSRIVVRQRKMVDRNGRA